MGTAKARQDDIWSLGQERGERPILESVLRNYYPEHSDSILEWADEVGDSPAFESVLRLMMDDGLFGEPFARKRSLSLAPIVTTELPLDPNAPPAIGQVRRMPGPITKRLPIETFAPMQRRGMVEAALSKVPEGVDPEKYWRARLGSKFYPDAEIDELIGMLNRGTVPEIMLSKDIPEWNAPFAVKDTVSGVKVLAQSMARTPYNALVQFLTIKQGHKGAQVVDKGWIDKLIQKRRDSTAAFEQEVVKKYRSGELFPGMKIAEVARFAQNLGFSVASMAAGAAAALPATAVGSLATPVVGVVAGAAAGMAATGTAAFQMASYEIMQSYLEMKDADKQAATGRGLTKAEENRLKKDFEAKAVKYGLWEAIPEAIAAGAWAAHLLKPLTLATGSKTGAMRLIAGTGKGLATGGMMFAEEGFTEMLTQMGQQATLVGTGMPEAKDVDWTNPGDYIDAFKTIAPQTFLLTAFLGGLGGGARVVKGRLVARNQQQIINSLKEEVGEQDPFFEPLKQKIEDVAGGDKQIIKDLIDITAARPELLSADPLQVPTQQEGDRVGMRPTGVQGTILAATDSYYDVQLDNGMRVRAKPGQFWRQSRPDFGTSQDIAGIEEGQFPVEPTESQMIRLEDVPFAEAAAEFPVEIPEDMIPKEPTQPAVPEPAIEPIPEAAPIEGLAPAVEPATVGDEMMPLSEVPITTERPEVPIEIPPEMLDLGEPGAPIRETPPAPAEPIAQEILTLDVGDRVFLKPHGQPGRIVEISPKVTLSPDRIDQVNLQKYLIELDDGTLIHTAPGLLSRTPPGQMVVSAEGPVFPAPEVAATVAEAAPTPSATAPVAEAEAIGPLMRGMPAGYFTDGVLLVKGEPPQGATVNTDVAEIAEAEPLLSVLDQDTEPAERTERGREVDEVGVVYKSGDQNFIYDPLRHNALAARFPDATYGITTRVPGLEGSEGEGVLVAFQDGEAVAALLPMRVERDTGEQAEGFGLQDADLDEWITEEGQKRTAEQEAAGQTGAVDFTRQLPQPLPDDPDITAALNAWRDTSGWMRRTAKSLAGGLKRLKDFGTAEQDPELRRAGFIQFQDDVRTGFIPILPRARHKWAAAKRAMWGNLNRKEKQSLMYLLALRNMNEDQQRGIPTVGPNGEEAPAVFATLTKFEAGLKKVSPGVLEAAQRYREFSFIVAKDLVDRKKLEPQSVRTDYFPIFNLEYLPEWWDLAPFAKRLAEEPFRRYTLQRRGRSKRIAYNETALDVHYTGLFADNMMEDWSLDQLQKYDISGVLTVEEKTEVYGVNEDTGKTLRPKHKRPYKYKGKEYIGVRYDKNNARWGLEANMDLLEVALEDAALDVDRLLTKGVELDINKLLEEGASKRIERVISRSPAEQSKMLRSYLYDVGPRGGDAVRRALILGKHVKTYVVPKAVGEKLSHLYSPLGVRWLRPFMQMTAMWKGATLGPFAASLPFVANQLVGDGLNAFRHNPRALSPQNIFSAVKIIANATPDAPSWVAKIPGFGRLSPTEQESLRISQDKDVFGSGFFREFDFFNRKVEKVLGNKPVADIVAHVMTAWGSSNSFREAILRVATVHENVKRVQKGLPVWMPENKNLQKGLDVESQIGVAGRVPLVDYLATPEYYNRWIRGFAFPFATFYQKNAVNWAQYMKNEPTRFFAKFVVPYVAADYHNEKRYPDVEGLLPGWIRERFHIIINSWDDDKDGLPDRARVFAPQLPLDMAVQMTGLHTFPSKIVMMFTKDAQGKPLMTPREAAIEQLREMWGGKFDVPTQLVNPMMQAFIGITANRDSFTKRRIVPRGMEGLPDEQQWINYKFPYILEKMVTPIGQYMRSTRGDDRVFGAIPSAKDIPSGASRYIRQTFNPLRGFGIYEIDLHKEFANQLMEPTFEAENMANAEVGKIIGDYIGSGQSPDEYIGSDEFAKSVERATESGVVLGTAEFPTPAAYIHSRITKPWVQISRLGRERDVATSDEDRKRIGLELREAMLERAIEVMKNTDKKAVPIWVKKLTRFFDSNPWMKPKQRGE